MNYVLAVLAVVILLRDAASAQLVMVPCLAVRPPAAVVAHVEGDEVVGTRKVFTYSKETSNAFLSYDLILDCSVA